MIEFEEHVAKMLQLAQVDLSLHKDLTANTGKVNAKGDQSIAMDEKIEQDLIDYLRGQNLPVRVFSEEIGWVDLHANPTHIVSFDPLDGSTNFKEDQGKGLLPYGALVSVYKGVAPRLSNVVAAGAMRYINAATAPRIWLYDGQQTTDLYGKPVLLRQEWEIGPSTPFYYDTFKSRRRLELATELVDTVFIRNLGSTIGNLELLLSGVSAGLAQPEMRAEEVGAVWALIKGAGGIIVDRNGHSLENEQFSDSREYEFFGGSSKIVNAVVEKLQKAA